MLYEAVAEADVKTRGYNIIKVDIVIPAYNEERLLEGNINKLVTFLRSSFPYKNYNIIIVNSGSVDKTFEIAERLQKKYGEITCINLSQKGRGLALKTVWLRSQADIVSYMDADLSTSLEAIPDLIDSITTEGYDLVVGSRFLPDSKVKRRFTRSFISYAYNSCIRRILGMKQIPDVQCGFKALNSKVVNKILPEVKNKNWFFDTELLLLAQESGFKIKYIPVNWTERLESKVKVLCTIFECAGGIMRMLVKNKLRLLRLNSK